MLEYITTGIGYLCLIGVFGVVSNYVYIMLLSVFKFVYKVLLRSYLSIKSYIESLWIKYFTNWEPHVAKNNYLEICNISENLNNHVWVKCKDNKKIRSYRILRTEVGNFIGEIVYLIPLETDQYKSMVKKHIQSLVGTKNLPIEGDMLRRGDFIYPYIASIVNTWLLSEHKNMCPHEIIKNNMTLYFNLTQHLSDTFSNVLLLDDIEVEYWRPSNTPEYKTDLILTIGSIMVSTLVSVALFLLS